MRFLCFATSTAPGPDGLPYAAWAQAGPAAATTLWFMLGWHASGLQPPLVFNQSALVFPPKGTHEADEELVAREPENTRPISLKNTDSKTVTGMANWSAKGWVAKHMHPSQRGFTWKRQLLENVVEIDTCGRIEAMKALSRPPTASLVPCFSFWDYAAAFPSVHHFFCFLYTTVLRIPDRVYLHGGRGLLVCGGTICWPLWPASFLLGHCWSSPRRPPQWATVHSLHASSAAPV